MLFMGVQFVIWSVTGAYMVFFNIDYIHGDSLVKNHQIKIVPENVQYSLKELLEHYPNAKRISVGKFMDKDVYRFSVEEKKTLLDAKTGILLTPLSKATAVNVAKYYYTGDGAVVSVELISENPPFELGWWNLPAWRVNFDDFGSPSLYISSQSGQLVTKRHEFWRMFDWMFRFHVMDYGEEEDVKNSLLFWATLFGILACLAGLVLTYFRVFKANKTKANKAKAERNELSTKNGII